MAFQSGGKTEEDSETGERVKSWDSIEGDADLDEAVELLKNTLGQITRVLKEGGHAYIFCDWRGIHEIKPLVEGVLNVKNVLVWDKGSMGIGDLENNWGYSHEFLIFATLGDRASELSDASRNVLEHGRPNRTDYEHPTMKPVSLLVELIQTATQRGDTVCDPFMGSGTTAVAAIQNDRDYVGFEIDEDNYRDVIERRIGEAKRQVEANQRDA
jgi:site-specific DNA-methyltransferase (adenine-specific)